MRFSAPSLFIKLTQMPSEDVKKSKHVTNTLKNVFLHKTHCQICHTTQQTIRATTRQKCSPFHLLHDRAVISSCTYAVTLRAAQTDGNNVSNITLQQNFSQSGFQLQHLILLNSESPSLEPEHFYRPALLSNFFFFSFYC